MKKIYYFTFLFICLVLTQGPSAQAAKHIVALMDYASSPSTS